MDRDQLRLPADEDPVVRAASAVIGGPNGRYARLRTEPWSEPSSGAEPADLTVPQRVGHSVPWLRRGRAAGVEGAARRALLDAADAPWQSRTATAIQAARRSIPVLPWAPVAAVLSFLAAAMLAVGVLQKGYCLGRGWSVPDAFWRGCYVDMPFLFANTGLVEAGLPYPADGLDAVAQPVGTGLALWLTALVVPSGGSQLVRQQWYMGIWILLIAVLLILLVVVTARTARRNPWGAAHVALSPLVVTVALVSPDLLGVLLASWGLFLWARERPAAAGAVLGLAAATRTYPVLFSLVVVLLAIRAGRLAPAIRCALATVLVWAAVLLVGTLTSGATVFLSYRTWWEAGADYGSLGYLARLADYEMPTGVMTVLAMLGWSVAALVGGVLALMPRHRPMVAEVCLVVVAIVVVTGKSVPVQSSLWLVPLVALAGLSWRVHLTWAAAEVAYFVAVWLHLGGSYDPNRTLPLPWFAAFTLVRDAGILLLVWVVFRRARARRAPAPNISPQEEVRDDPDDVAGPLTGAKDALVVAVT